MLKREEKEIDGLTYTSVQFPAMYGFGLLARLAKSIGPAVAALGNVSPDTDLGDLGPSLSTALASLDPAEAQQLVVDVLKSTSVYLPDITGTGGRKIEFADKVKIDEAFSGKLKTLFKVLGFALQVNFADFAPGTDVMATVVPGRPVLSA